MNPSASFRVLGLTLTLSYERSGLGSSSIVAMDQLEKNIHPSLENVRLEISDSTDSPVFNVRLMVGSFSGGGAWDFIKDTSQFVIGEDSFRVETKSLIFDFFLHGLSRSHDFLRDFIGIRYLAYRLPLELHGTRVPDPRDSDRELTEVELSNTRINHIFLVWDVLAQFKEGDHQETPTTSARFSLAGHWLYHFFGAGWANHDTGRTGTTLSLGGFDMDVGLNFLLPLGRSSAIDATAGVRWISWEIGVYGKGGRGEATAHEVLLGPYVEITLTL